MNITFKLISLIVCFKISSASLVAVKQQNWSQISFLVHTHCPSQQPNNWTL